MLPDSKLATFSLAPAAEVKQLMQAGEALAAEARPVVSAARSSGCEAVAPTDLKRFRV